jgi:phospholipid/cholesterol/gamma-HCH transport system permease protein
LILVLGWLNSVGEFFYLAAKSLQFAFTPPVRMKDIIKQTEFVAVQSAPIVVFCVCFAAVVVVIEASFHMRIVIQNDSLVPGFAALLILRELGVVVACLLVTSRVGAGLAAEVSSMQITEQVDALRLLGIHPIKFLVVPRLIACVIGCVLLTVIANIVCLYGAMLVTQYKMGFGPANFLSAMKAFVSFQDLVFAMIKGAVFGAIIPIVSCFFGFRCKAGAEGVGTATTNAVVTASVLIIFADFILSFLFSSLY